MTAISVAAKPLHIDVKCFEKLHSPSAACCSCGEALKPLNLGCISAVELFCSQFEAQHSATRFVLELSSLYQNEINRN